MSIIETMKAEADKIGREFVSHREGGAYLVNCRSLGDGRYEWRVLRDPSRGSVITEKHAGELLAAMSPHMLVASSI